MAQELILASASVARNRLLRNAGVLFRTVASGIDEAAIKQKLKLDQKCPSEVVVALATAKAISVGTQYPGNTIIGSDQLLVCDGQWFDKPTCVQTARNHLERLSGRVHKLVNATVITRDNKPIWNYQNIINVEMRKLSIGLIDEYLAKEGGAVCESVGAYKLEGYGAQLLTQVDGDFFSILGLPILPLLRFLREQDILR